MSVKVMTWVWDRSRTEGNDRLVLLAIADHANHDGRDAYPSVETLAAMTNLSERTVQRAINRCVELGELRVELNAGGGADWRTDRRPNRYEVLLAHVADRARRARKKASRHGATAVSPRHETVNDTGVLPQVPGPGSGGAGTPSERGDTGDAPSSDARGDTSDGHGVTPDAPRGDTRVALSVLDPSIDPSTSPNPRAAGANPRAVGTDPRATGTNPRALALDEFLAADDFVAEDPVPIANHLRRMRHVLDDALEPLDPLDPLVHEGAQP